MGIFSWLRPKKKFRFPFDEKEYLERKRKAEKAGQVDGKFYVAHVEKVKQLKRQKKWDEAERLLIKLDAAAEAESKIMGYPSKPPWYSRQLGIVRRQKQREIAKAAKAKH